MQFSLLYLGINDTTRISAMNLIHLAYKVATLPCEISR